MIEKYGMRLFYATFALLGVGMAILTQLDADLPETEAHVVLEGEVDAAVLTVDVQTGYLDLHAIAVDDSDAEALLVGEFVFEDEDASAAADITEDGNLGILTVRQNGDDITSPTENTFDIKVSPLLPLDVAVVRATGSSELDMRDLNLHTFNATLGTGHNVVELGPRYELLTDVLIDGGDDVDNVTVDCDCIALTQLEIDTADGADHLVVDGDYPLLNSLQLDTAHDNDTAVIRGRFETLAAFDMELGRGDDRLVVVGEFPALRIFNVDVGRGDDQIDLSHEFNTNMDVNIITHAGTVRIYLPREVGVAVSINGPDTEVSVTNMNQEGLLWVNDAYATNDEQRMRVTITAGNVETIELIAGPPREPLVEQNAALPALENHAE